MQSPIDQQIRSRIDQFLAELDALVRKAAVESVQQALSGDSAPRPARAPAPARKAPGASKKRPAKAAASTGKPGKSGRRARRSSELVAKLGDLVHAFVASNPGARLDHIAAGIQVDSRDLKRPLRTLVMSGALRSEGQRRGTRYFPGSGRGKGAAKGTSTAAKPRQ